MPCTAGLERHDYLDFLPKRPQGTTKILGTPAFAGTKTPAALKFPSKGATTDCLENPRKLPALRAEVTGQSVGFGASPLSCFLFRPRKSCENRRKRSHTNVSNTLVTRTSIPPVQTAHVRFRGRKRVHTRLSEKNRTQGHTRRNRGVLDGGGITTLGPFCAVRKPCVARG